MPPPPVVTGGVILVSLIVTEPLLATTAPDELVTVAVNVSAPSVVRSAVGLALNDPELLVILNDPELVEKSPLLDTDQ